MSKRFEIAKKILEQGCCEGCSCTECPADKLETKKGCDFCRNFNSNEEALEFFSKIEDGISDIEKLEQIMQIVDEIASIPFYAYGDNEAACTMMDAIKKIGEIALSK